jgi:hypothetical protein
MTFWSIFASLGLQLFYFSVWQLGKPPSLALFLFSPRHPRRRHALT